MNAAILLLFAPLLAVDDRDATAEAVEPLEAIHIAEATKWQMYVDAARTTKAELNLKPVYIWTNPTRGDGQDGLVLVWTHLGRPVAIGSIFSHPEKGRRMVCHEFHSLATNGLFPMRNEGETWEPQGGVMPIPLSGAPQPAISLARRRLQMRDLSRQFTAHSIDFQKERWELRLLPQPLLRYDKPQGDVIDGALFAFVTSAGTDPEIVLLIEARQTGEAVAWHYRAIRFSDSDLFVNRDGKEIWSSVRDDRNQLHFNPDHTYRLIRDKYIDDPLIAP
jgi:hypothetical protein